MNTTIRTTQPRDWWNTIALGLVVVIALLVIGLNACSSSSPGVARNNAVTPATARSVATTQGNVPTSLSNAGEYGENVYDYAKANDWKNAQVKLAALKDAIKSVRADVKNRSTAADLLATNVATVDRAVAAKDRQATMREANQITLDVANMTTAYKLTVPVEVTKLDYYGRELEVWGQAKDANKLEATAGELQRQWQALRPSIAEKSAAEATRFDALVARRSS
jgi:hypothetical protein